MYNKEQKKEYYLKNKDKWIIDTEEKRLRKRLNQKAYTLRHPEKTKQRRIDWANNNINKGILNQVRRRAQKANLAFDLDLSDIRIPETCPYIGCPITTGWGKGQVPTNASIDRIDNSKGYIKGNIQIISRRANTMKSDATEEQLVAFAKGVIAMHSKEVDSLCS